MSRSTIPLLQCLEWAGQLRSLSSTDVHKRLVLYHMQWWLVI